MEIFYIPFKPHPSYGWKIPVSQDAEKQFTSRNEALAFARKLAKQRIVEQHQSSYLCIEGHDKKWRLFTPDLAPVD